MADEADQADKVRAEAKLSRFEFEQVLNQDQGGRRVTLQGRIDDQSCILTIERCAFPTSPSDLSRLPSSLQRVQNLSSNDIYAWYLASCGGQSSDTGNEDAISTPDVKVNLIHPCTEAHIKKYSRQGVRMVTETPHIYRERIQPYMQRKREEGRLNWVWNIIEGRTEQEDVILRVSGGEEGFLVLPDLNWDRITLTSLHLLAIVERRDIWSLRDLKKRHIPWLQHMREKLLDATPNLYPGIEKDQLKLYIHYQPTYYHFHIHIVHAAFDAGVTQATGKAFGLENIISQLETCAGGDDAGMADVSLTYFVGEASELWTDVFLPLKEAQY